QAPEASLVVLLVLEAQLAKQPVDPRLERGRCGIGYLLRDVVEREAAMQELEHDGPGLVEMVIARSEHSIGRRSAASVRAPSKRSPARAPAARARARDIAPLARAGGKPRKRRVCARRRTIGSHRAHRATTEP